MEEATFDTLDGVSVNVVLETVGGWSGGGDGGAGEPLEFCLTDELLELELLELELLIVIDVAAAVAVSSVGAVVMEEVD